MNVPFPMFPGWARPMDTASDIDPYAAYRAAPDESDLQAIRRLAAELVAANRTAEEAEKAFDRAKDRVRQLAEKEIPELMSRAGQRSGLVTADGIRVDVKDVVRANIPVSRRDEAYDWLDAHGEGGMIKRAIEVPFGQDSEKDVLVQLDVLRESYPDARVTKKIESSTLAAWVRERLRSGESVPDELISVHQMPVASATAK